MFSVENASKQDSSSSGSLLISSSLPSEGPSAHQHQYPVSILICNLSSWRGQINLLMKCKKKSLHFSAFFPYENVCIYKKKNVSVHK